MEIHDTNVEVLYDFEYSTKDGQTVTIKEGEKLLLIKKTNNDWWQVIRSTGKRPFYVPSTYVKELDSPVKEKIVVDVRQKEENRVQGSPVNPPHNFTVSVNIRPGPGGEVQKPVRSSSRTKVLINCDVSEKSSGYSVVQVSKPKDDTLAEANILDDNLSSSLAEIAKQIKFRSNEKLKYSGSFKTAYERKILLRSLSGSTPDLSSCCLQDGVDTGSDVSRIKSVEQLKDDPDLVTNILCPTLVTVKSAKPSIRLRGEWDDNRERLAVSRSGGAVISSSWMENNHLKDSTDSVEAASSSESIELKPRLPVAKPRRNIQPKVDEEVIYANCQDLVHHQREESPVPSGTRSSPVPSGTRSSPVPSSTRSSTTATTASADVPPSGWSMERNRETNLTSYIHSLTGDKWHSARDSVGRVYYFRENSSESSWTLPSHHQQQQPPAQSSPEPEPSPPQITEDERMSIIFSKISNIDPNPRKLRNTKAYSLIVTNNVGQLNHPWRFFEKWNRLTVGLRAFSKFDDNEKEESDVCSSLWYPWPELSDGRMSVICEGPLHYAKICEGGKRVRKSWTSAYLVLTEIFLLIYKDIKAFHSLKALPEMTVDLNGAVVSSGEKVSGRKHVLVVSTQNELGLQVALQCENINSALHWATTIQRTINALPKVAIESVQSSRLGSITEGGPPEDAAKKGSSIGRSKSVNFKNKDDSMEDLGVCSAERQVKIRARLKKFFHKRPTMESLVKKGIWKDEPVFGCYLEQACGHNNPKVPQFVQRCIALIESSTENMKTDGLYRASGNLSQIQKIRLQIDQNNYTALEREEDVHVLTGALKLFFRELKEPLIPYRLFPKAIKASTTTNKKERLSMFVDIVKALPTANRDTLKFLLQHLLRVTQFQEHNRMHVANVAIVFGPTLMWPQEESLNMALDLIQQNMVIEALLIDFHSIFK